jgi:hypothetical protein
MEQEQQIPITPEEARASLAEIDQVTLRIRQTIAAGITAPLLILWGSIWMVCFATEQYYPVWSQKVWFTLVAVGTVVSMLSGLYQSPIKTNGASPLMGRMGLAWLILFAYAALWARYLGPWEIPHHAYNALLNRKWGAYTCTICMFAYTLMGLWLDRVLMYLGIAVTILTLVGYLYAADYFYVWMAVTGGGALLLTGLFIRKFWR